MNIFGEPYNRGCFVKKQVDSGGGQGARLSLSGTMLPSGASDPFIVSGFSMRKEETIAIMRCFKDQSFIYAFGDNIEQSILSVKIIALMPASSGGAAVSTMIGAYASGRISKSTKLSYLTYGGSSALKGYVLGLDSSTVSAEYGLQSFDIKLLLV